YGINTSAPTHDRTAPSVLATIRNPVTTNQLKPNENPAVALLAPRIVPAATRPTRPVGRQSGCASSGLNASGDFSRIDDNIGISVSDTTSEIINATDTVSAWSLNS